MINNDQIKQLLYWYESMPHFRDFVAPVTKRAGITDAEYLRESKKLVSSGACENEEFIRSISAQISLDYIKMEYGDEYTSRYIAFEYTISKLNIHLDDYVSIWDKIHARFANKNYVFSNEEFGQHLFDATKIFLDKGDLDTEESYEKLKRYIVDSIDINKEHTTTPENRKTILLFIQIYIQHQYFVDLQNVRKNMYIPPGFSR